MTTPVEVEFPSSEPIPTVWVHLLNSNETMQQSGVLQNNPVVMVGRWLLSFFTIET